MSTHTCPHCRGLDLQDIALVQLSGRLGAGRYAIVDASDLPEIVRYRWWLHSQGYAVRKTTVAERSKGHPRFMFMHRQVLRLQHDNTSPVVVDHRNRNKLDNRRDNLRLVSQAKNGQNTTGRGRSQFKGVYWSDVSGGWVWQVSRHGRRYCESGYASETDAARAHDAMAVAAWGEDATTNYSLGLLDRGPDAAEVERAQHRLSLRPRGHTHGRAASSIYRGVSWHSSLRKWMAGIRANGKTMYLGVFADEAQAARAYDAAALDLKGETATTNVALGLLPEVLN